MSIICRDVCLRVWSIVEITSANNVLTVVHIIEVSLSEPHTSETALQRCVSVSVCLSVCLSVCPSAVIY